MKPAAYVANGPSLAKTLGELRALNAKVFASTEAVALLEKEGIHAQELRISTPVVQIYGFGHKAIHLFGCDCSIDDEGATRVCFENRVFYTTQELAAKAQRMLNECLDVMAKGVNIQIHGDGMFPHMAAKVVQEAGERVLTAIYDMQVAPPTYEIFNFLAAAEKHRIDHGFTSIDLLFLPGPMYGFRDDGLPPSVAERRSMLHRICVSGARLLPSVRDVHVMKKRVHVDAKAVFPQDWQNDRPRFAYGPKFQRNGHRCLVATEAARIEVGRRFQAPYVTITLREAEYWSTRNSNIAAWSMAARWLRHEGLQPVIVPDTHGHSRIHDGDEYAPAAWDVDLRMALYERAVLNLFVSNGPMALPMLAAKPCPYIMFLIQDGSVAVQNEFLEANGIKFGDQWSDHGLTIWEPDTLENVERALEAWFAAKAVAA